MSIPSQTLSYNRPVPDWALPLTRIIFILALLVLTYNSVRPVTSMGGIPNFDKVLHAAAYFVLAVLLAMAAPRMRLTWIVILPCLYGGGLEIAQSLMASGRTGSLYDMAANIAGAGFAGLVWWFIAYFLLKVRI